ncbi:hypothetical protein NRIC_20450 [Enterococcus florum]|uniref:histidine kinase n=1 Tax=Enterococcus florum TaxID=2480627 RepID=A0A4P5PCD5_9ENTE|nr:HAMP domain-containing sensor histidine kinase [Enterococcus florum]GCF94154.1 hypothetical protein NRIC_20450 [Enterococcus florum]
MKELKHAILCSFVCHFLGLSLTVGLLEEVATQLRELIVPVEYQFILLFSSVAAQVIVIGVFSFLFYRSLDKRITAKSQEIAQQQRLLFANIAHDLKTPLTSITGFSKALQEEIVDPVEQKEVAEIIYQKALTADELLDAMFQYTKLTAADYPLKRELQDVNYLLKETIAESYDLLEQHQIDLIVELPEAPMMRAIDKVEMKRVFVNLLVNACKHNPLGTKLRITIEEKKNSAQIIFADDGTKIPSEKRTHLFHPFVSENETERHFQGSGLGLAITKSIIEKHGFMIELEDDERFTKRFVVIL